jgi:hypothetical protein
MEAALYSSTGTLIASTGEVTGISGSQWVTFSFSGTKPTLTAGTTYNLVVWGDSGGSNTYLYYSGTATNAGHYQTNINYSTWPNSITFTNDNNQYCIYCTYSIP